MKPDARIFDDLSRVAGGAMNVFSGLREQILNDIRARFDEMASRMDLVPREDFDRLTEQVQALQGRLDALSPSQPSQRAQSKPKTTKKSAAKKAAKPAKKKA